MIPFYSRAQEERLALAEAAIRERRTLMERWEALQSHEAEPWAARAKLAASLLSDQPSVTDFGCGVMSLAQFLRTDQTYVPVDVVARDERTLVCDLNLDPPPATGTAAAALLGVMEYLFDPAALLAKLRQEHKVLIASYCITDAPRKYNRREHGWVNDFSEAGMVAIFEAAGWQVEYGVLIEDLQKVWRLRGV